MNKKNSGSRSSLRATSKNRPNSARDQSSEKRVVTRVTGGLGKAKRPDHADENQSAAQRVVSLKSDERTLPSKSPRMVDRSDVSRKAEVNRGSISRDSQAKQAKTGQAQAARVVAAIPRVGLVKQSIGGGVQPEVSAGARQLHASRPLLAVEKGGAAKDSVGRIGGQSVAQKIRDAQVARGARIPSPRQQATVPHDAPEKGAVTTRAGMQKGVSPVAVGSVAVAVTGVETNRSVPATPKLALVAKAGTTKPGSHKSPKGNLGSAGSIPATKITRAEPSDSHRLGHGSSGAKAEYGSGKAVVQPIPLVGVVAAVEPTLGGQEEAFGDASGEEFRLGDKIVYPGHGVGEVEGVRATVLGGQEHRIYNIKIFHSGMKVMVPVAQSRAVGLRRIIDKRAIDQVYDILRMREVKIDLQTWNRRSREYAQKMKSGSPFEIAVVLRDLLILSVDKELSFSEKKMLDAAEALLVSEIAIARSRPHESIAGELRALFA